MERKVTKKKKKEKNCQLSNKQPTYVCYPPWYEFSVGHVQFAIKLCHSTCFSVHSLCKCDQLQSDDVAKSIQPK